MAHKPTAAQIKATAMRAGHTKRVIVEAGANDLYGYVKPNADFDGIFTLIDDDDGTVFNVQGWNVLVRDLED